MKYLITGICLFLLGLAWVPATHADEKADYQAALEKDQKGQHEQAVIAFQTILVNDPDSWQAYQGMGDAFRHEGDKDGALQAYQRSLQLHSDNPAVKALVDKLSAEAKAVSEKKERHKKKTVPTAPESKFHPIQVQSQVSGLRASQTYYFEGHRLKNDQELGSIIDSLNDAQASSLIKAAKAKSSGGDVLGILCGGLIVGGVIYALTAPQQTVTNNFGLISSSQPDLGPAFALGGIGAGLGLIGMVLEGDAGQKRVDAVNRYDYVIGADPNSPTGDAPVTQSSSWEASQPSTVTDSPTPVAGSDKNKPILSLSPLVNFPLSKNTAYEYVPALGFDLDIQFPMDEKLSLVLSASFEDFPMDMNHFAQTFQQTYGQSLPAGVSVNGDWRYLPVAFLVEDNLTAGNSPVVPYFLGGVGLSFNFNSASASYGSQSVGLSTNETDFLLCPGLGVKFRLDSAADLFLQGRLDINFTSQNDSDVISVTANGQSGQGKGNLSDDSPTIFMPVQIGLSFK